VEVQVDYTFSEFAGLRFGQFYVPFGFESTTSASDLDMINYAQAVEKLAPGRDLGTTGRDVGAILTGSYSIFDYSVGFFNGQGANKADTNDKKDFSGRLRLKPISSVSLGASVYKGLYSAAAGTPAVVRDRFGLDASVALGEATVKGEYLWAVDDKIHKSGWFVRAGYFLIPKKVQVLGMWDSFDKDTDIADDRVSVYTAGVNWFLAERTKVQLNYEYTRSELAATVNKALLIQFQAGF
jgi:phosphate-selective porin